MSFYSSGASNGIHENIAVQQIEKVLQDNFIFQWK